MPNPDTSTINPLVSANWELPTSISTRLGEVGGNQRAIHGDDHLLLLIHQLPALGESERQTLTAWRSPDGQWQTFPHSGGVPVIDRSMEAYENKIDELEAREEAARRSHEFHNILEELSPVLRAIRGVHRTLQQAHLRVPEDRDILLWRDDAAEIVRAAELLNDDARFGLQFIAASQAESQAAASHRLNMLVAIFLPLTTLGAIFGMNIPNGLEHNGIAFFVVLIVGFISGLVLREISRTGLILPDFRLPKAKKKQDR